MAQLRVYLGFSAAPDHTIEETMLIRFVDKSVLGSSIPRWIVLCYILICYATG